jgi:DNA repair protein SbcD/Mre11
VAHAFAAGGMESESERSLSVGGAGTVDVACFDGLHYVALGHLHRPQSAGPDHVHYSGSLLKYSFSEATHTKAVNLVEMDARGDITIERVPLTPRRDVRCVRGTLKALLEGPQDGESHEDYLMATLTDAEPILDPMGKLLPVYPNLLHIERTYLSGAGAFTDAAQDHRGLTDLELFRAFFSQATGEDLSREEELAFSEIVEKLRREEREAK